MDDDLHVAAREANVHTAAALDQAAEILAPPEPDPDLVLAGRHVPALADAPRDLVDTPPAKGASGISRHERGMVKRRKRVAELKRRARRVGTPWFDDTTP